MGPGSRAKNWLQGQPDLSVRGVLAGVLQRLEAGKADSRLDLDTETRTLGAITEFQGNLAGHRGHVRLEGGAQALLHELWRIEPPRDLCQARARAVDAGCDSFSEASQVPRGRE